jgi:hypothetical protein
MQIYGGAEVQVHAFSSFALDRGECSASGFSRFTPRKNRSIHWLGGWVYPSADADVVAKRKAQPFWESNPGFQPTVLLENLLSYPFKSVVRTAHNFFRKK